MKGIFTYTQRIQSKTFLFSILLLSLFTSATNYSSYTELIIKPDSTLVHRESKDGQAVSYYEAIQIAFNRQNPNYSRFQEHVYSLKNTTSFLTYVKYYVRPQPNRQYIYIVSNHSDDLPPTLLS